MADTKISALTLKSPAAVTDVLPIVDNSTGITKKTTIQDVIDLATSGSGSATSINVNQASHGLSVGYVIRLSGTNTYVLAKADSAANAEVVGIVTAVSDVDNFTYVTEGAITVGVPAVAAGTVLFLSPTSAGTLTATAPTTAGQISMPLATVTENAVKMVFHKYRGMELGSTSVGATSVATYTAATDTLSLTTGANDKVVVWAKGEVEANTESTVTLKYDGTTKDTLVLSAASGNYKRAFALEYTETPGAGTKNITVVSDQTDTSNVVIIAQVITPVSVQNSITSTSGVSAGPASSSTQTITHNLGRIPTIIRLIGYGKGTGATADTGSTNGFYNSSGNNVVYVPADIDATPVTSSSFAIFLSQYNSGESHASGVVQNVGITTFDIVWTATADISSVTSFIWEAQ